MSDQLFIQQWARTLGVTQPINGSWLQAIAAYYGITRTRNESWEQAIAFHLGQPLPINQTWLQAIALDFGFTSPINENWMQTLSGASGPIGTAPVNTIAPLLSGTVSVGNDLFLTSGTWTGTAPISYVYSFYVNSILRQQGLSQSYTLQSADAGFNVNGLVDAQNAFGSAFAASNTLGPVTQAPVNTGLPVISGLFVSGNNITTTNGTWIGTTPITFSYQWQSSVDGSTVWTNVGTNSNTFTITSSAAQLLFYRCQVTANNGIGSAVATSAVAGGVDSQAQTHFNRVTADSGVMTYGLVGVDTITKNLKFIYNITDVAALNIDGKWLDYFGYKLGSGSGVTAGRALMKSYSILGANFDYVQNTTTAQPALAAWNGTNYLATFAGSSNNVNSTSKSNPNNTKITIVVRFRKVTTNNNSLVSHRSGAVTNWSLNWGSGLLSMTLADNTGNNLVSPTLPNGLNFDGWVRLIITTSGSDLVGQYATSTDGTNFTNLGTAITAAGKAGQIGSSNQTFNIAEWQSRTGIGAEYLRALVYDANDTLLFDFNPNSYNRSVNATQWTSVTGEIYTISTNSATTGLKAMIVDQTMIQGNGTTMGMQAASASLNSLVLTQYNVFRKFSNAASSGSNAVLIEYGNITTGQGFSFVSNDIANTETINTRSDVGILGSIWNSNSLLLKVSTIKVNILGSPYEATLLTNNLTNTFNSNSGSSDNTTAIVATGKNLMARNNASSVWSNSIWVGELMTTQTDTAPQETAIYNMFADGSNII